MPSRPICWRWSKVASPELYAGQRGAGAQYAELDRCGGRADHRLCGLAGVRGAVQPSNINIAERVKEIATIKVLGFYDPEVYAYVNRESVVLTLIGTLFGLAGGIVLHSFIIRTVEVDAVMFGREVYPYELVYS